MKEITLTMDALTQHIKRAVYQGAHCWGNILEAAPKFLHLKIGAGFILTVGNLYGQNFFRPASSHEKSCVVAAKRVAGRCKCRKPALKCTALCSCDD